MKPAADSQILRCTSPAAAMQRITDALAAGLSWYTAGELPAEKWPRVEAKLAARYPLLMRDRFAVYRAKKAGESRQRLIVFQPKGESRVGFFLLTSVVDSDEPWRDSTNKHTRPRLWNYEAVRITKPGANAPLWSWRIESTAYAQLRNTLIERIRKHQDTALVEWIDSTRKWPGFAQVRRQHFALGLLLQGEWSRSRAGEAIPDWPRLRYVQRLKTR